METAKSPGDRVLERLFEKLVEDPAFSKSTLARLEKARDEGTLGDVKEIVEACHLAGGTDAEHSPS
jgi:hypothetical protein